jgi:hypothetical protein
VDNQELLAVIRQALGPNETTHAKPGAP